jgi:hypothetical protein
VIDQAMGPFPKEVCLAGAPLINNMGLAWPWSSRARRSLRLALLAPDIIEAILAGGTTRR